MLISTPNFGGKGAGNLTPTMVRGAFLVWRSELQLGKKSAEIREFGNPSSEITELGNRSPEITSNATPEQITAGAFDNPAIPLRKFTRRNLASWGDDLRGTLGWEEDTALR